MIRAAIGYMGAKRKQLVEKHGFDCKNAGHAVRLLHMGAEYLDTGLLYVRRTWDREMLIEIKQGKWSLARVKDHVFAWMEKMPSRREHSPLPEAIDFDKVEELAVSIMQLHLSRSRSHRDARFADSLRRLASELKS